MAIGEFSSRCWLSAKVLRNYARAGVLAPALVDPDSGYRYYDAAQLGQAATVRLLRRAGVSLGDIGRFLQDPSSDAVEGWERSLTAEALSRRDALAEVRGRLSGVERTRGARVIELRPVRDVAELRTVFDLLGAQLPEPIDRSDGRIHDLEARFTDDGPLMVVATAGDEVVGGALAFRHANGAVTLRLVAVVEGFRHRGIGRRLVERVETACRVLGSHTVGLGTEDAVGFWYHLGYTANLLFQWVYDADRAEQESEAMLRGPLAGLRYWWSSFNDVPQLFVELDEPRLDLRGALRDTVTGCHVGFMMLKKF
jgi:DNA-binding transcriptional MerR regulator